MTTSAETTTAEKTDEEKAEFREGVKLAFTLYAELIAQLMDRGADIEVAAVLGATELDDETLSSVILEAMARDRVEFAKTGHEFSIARQTCSLMIAAASLEQEARGKGKGAVLTAELYAEPDDLERMRRVRREFKSTGRRATGMKRNFYIAGRSWLCGFLVTFLIVAGLQLYHAAVQWNRYETYKAARERIRHAEAQSTPELRACLRAAERPVPGVAIESLREAVGRQQACRELARLAFPEARPGSGLSNKLEPPAPSYFTSLGAAISSFSLVGAGLRLAQRPTRQFQEDPTFALDEFLNAYPDQLKVIQPLLDAADPTSPVLDHALETLADARSEGEARHIIEQIRESQRRLESAYGNTLGHWTGLGLGLAIDGLLLASLGGGLASLVRARSASRLNLA